MNKYACILVGGFLTATSIGASAQATKHVPLSRAPLEAALSDPPAASVIGYNDRDVVPVKTKLRFTTLIILPKNEQILDFTCGDKEFWVVNGNQNFAFIKPAKAGARTNLNLITASGNVYSFLVSEVSETKLEPDLKVF